jgi:predicted enzyme related to lactoylglutathione lyase
MTTDPEAAGKFYKKVIGWETQKWEGGGADTQYTMFTNAGTHLGGVMPLPEQARAAGAPPHWLAYTATPDIDRTVADAKKKGARVHVEPTEIPTVGKFAVLADPQGAAFALFTTDREFPGHDGPAKKGEFSWHELMTTDHEAAFDFYHDLFGWEKTDAMDMGEMGVYQMYGRNGMPIGGMFNKTADMPFPPNWLHYVRVDDVHKTAEQIKQNGGQIINGPMEVPGGDWIAQCMDPQGGMFAIHHTKS